MPNNLTQSILITCVNMLLLDKQRNVVAYLDGLQVKVNVVRESQSALMPSMLDKAFKGEF